MMPLYKASIVGLIISFVSSSLYIPPAHGSTLLTTGADGLNLPKPGVMVHLSPEFTPALLKGIVIHPQDAFKFDFIVYKGDQQFTEIQKKQEYTKLIKYFLASLAVPDEDQWVNLSPYEKDRIIKDDFGKTTMGRDLLAQDYLLKQITASLIYPQDKLGRKFWDEVYSRAYKEFGTANIPVNTFNKVWIVPDEADIYEKGKVAYLYKSHLKVMLEQDYLAMSKHADVGVTEGGASPSRAQAFASTAGETRGQDPNISALGSQIVRAIILPQLEKEVNEGKNFAPLRQVFSGMILAAWYKRALRESLLGKIYANKAKVRGVDQDPKNNEAIYQQYLKAYKKGVFNYIQEDVDKYTNATMPRKYFSGGWAAPKWDDGVLRRHSEGDASAAMAAAEDLRTGGPRVELAAVSVDPNQNDAAMTTLKLGQEESFQYSGRPIVVRFPGQTFIVTKKEDIFITSGLGANDGPINPEFILRKASKDVLRITAHGEEITVRNIDFAKVNAGIIDKDQESFYQNKTQLANAFQVLVEADTALQQLTKGMSLTATTVTRHILGNLLFKGMAMDPYLLEFQVSSGINEEFKENFKGDIDQLDRYLDMLVMANKDIDTLKQEATALLSKQQVSDNDLSLARFIVSDEFNQEFVQKIIPLRKAYIEYRNTLNTAIGLGLTNKDAAMSVNGMVLNLKQFAGEVKAGRVAPGTLVELYLYRGILRKVVTFDHLDNDVLPRLLITDTSAVYFARDISSIQVLSVEKSTFRKRIDSWLSSVFGVRKDEAMISRRTFLIRTVGTIIGLAATPQVAAQKIKKSGKHNVIFYNDGDFEINEHDDYYFGSNKVKAKIELRKDGHYIITFNFAGPFNVIGLRDLTKDIKFFDVDPNGLRPVGLSRSPSPDKAMKGDYGGIDFNAANLKMNIKRDGNGVPLPVSQQDLENIHIDGLVPVILEIRPAAASLKSLLV